VVWRVSENGRGQKGIREWIELKLNHNKIPKDCTEGDKCGGKNDYILTRVGRIATRVEYDGIYQNCLVSTDVFVEQVRMQEKR